MSRQVGERNVPIFCVSVCSPDSGPVASITAPCECVSQGLLCTPKTSMVLLVALRRAPTRTSSGDHRLSERSANPQRPGRIVDVAGRLAPARHHRQLPQCIAAPCPSAPSRMAASSITPSSVRCFPLLPGGRRFAHKYWCNDLQCVRDCARSRASRSNAA